MHIVRSYFRRAVIFGGALLLATAAPVDAQQPKPTDSFGVLKPTFQYETTVIAVPSFGKDASAPVEWDTMPRVIRRDLELSGFFQMPADQQAVNWLNRRDVSNSTVSYDKWGEMGAKHLLMADISVPSPGVLRARVLLHDIDSREMILNRNIDGRVGDVRGLAHKISDEVVKMVKFCDGIAQTRLIYINEPVPGIKEVAIMDSDGFNQKNLTHYNNICTTPAWGANGTEVYYTSYKGNRANIYGQMLSSGQSWTIAGYGGTNHSPSWSQAAGRIVMVLSKDGGSELYTSKRDGTDLRRLTKSEAIEASPVWSPDGRQIAYTSNEAGGVNIFIINADGSGKRRLTRVGSWNDAPSWSPDGQWIAFVSRQGGTNDIYVINQNGDANTARRLTMNQGNNESPSWAPNSRHLAFSSDRHGQWQIFMMLDDGSNQRTLTSSGRNIQPSWGPMPPQ